MEEDKTLIKISSYSIQYFRTNRRKKHIKIFFDGFKKDKLSKRKICINHSYFIISNMTKLDIIPLHQHMIHDDDGRHF